MHKREWSKKLSLSYKGLENLSKVLGDLVLGRLAWCQDKTLVDLLPVLLLVCVLFASAFGSILPALENKLVDSDLLTHIFALGIVSTTLLMRTLAVFSAQFHDSFGVEHVSNLSQPLDVHLMLLFHCLSVANFVHFWIKLATSSLGQLLVWRVLVRFRFLRQAFPALSWLQGAAAEFLIVLGIAAGIVDLLPQGFIQILELLLGGGPDAEPIGQAQLREADAVESGALAGWLGCTHGYSIIFIRL